jgi:AraC-like DNA-binding protein
MSCVGPPYGSGIYSPEYRQTALIKEGKKANEAGNLVGYNSPAQFSREYKRRFGYAPSLT